MVVNGQAAFNIMGDWASGYMSTTLKLEPGTGYGWAASPGTEGVFIMLSDSFGLPVGCRHRDNAIAWLRMLGSLEGQDTFNPLKGSISARVDSDLSKYNVYLQSAANDWRTNKIVGSLAHGVVANERFMNDFATVMDIFLASKNAEAAANAAEAVAIRQESEDKLVLTRSKIRKALPLTGLLGIQQKGQERHAITTRPAGGGRDYLPSIVLLEYSCTVIAQTMRVSMTDWG